MCLQILVHKRTAYIPTYNIRVYVICAVRKTLFFLFLCPGDRCEQRTFVTSLLPIWYFFILIADVFSVNWWTSLPCSTLAMFNLGYLVQPWLLCSNLATMFNLDYLFNLLNCEFVQPWQPVQLWICFQTSTPKTDNSFKYIVAATSSSRGRQACVSLSFRFLSSGFEWTVRRQGVL